MFYNMLYVSHIREIDIRGKDGELWEYIRKTN